MDGQEEIRRWIEEEAEKTREGMNAYRKKTYAQIPICCLIIMAVMIGLGFLSGSEVSYIMKVHVPVGIGLCVFAVLIFLLCSKSGSVKKVEKLYEKGIRKYLPDPADQELLLKQICCGEYREAEFAEKSGNGVATKVLIGKDVWVYRNYLCCFFVKVSEVERVKDSEALSTIKVGNTWRQVSSGMNLEICFKKEAGQKKGKPSLNWNLPGRQEAIQTYALMDKYCHHLFT